MKNTREFEALVRRVRSEFNEMPGLRLTRHHACRLLGLEPSLCAAVIDSLLQCDFLRDTPGGQLIRA